MNAKHSLAPFVLDASSTLAAWDHLTLAVGSGYRQPEVGVAGCLRRVCMCESE
jgi:hypothetical protein